MKHELVFEKITLKDDTVQNEVLNCLELKRADHQIIPPGWYRLELKFDRSIEAEFGPIVKCYPEYQIESLAATSLCFPIRMGHTFAYLKTDFPGQYLRIFISPLSASQNLIHAQLKPLKKWHLALAIFFSFLRFSFFRCLIPLLTKNVHKAVFLKSHQKNPMSPIQAQVMDHLRMPQEYAAWLFYYQDFISNCLLSGQINSKLEDAKKYEFLLFLKADQDDQWHHSIRSTLAQTRSKWKVYILLSDDIVLTPQSLTLIRDPRIQVIPIRDCSKIFTETVSLPSSLWMGLLTPGNELHPQALECLSSKLSQLPQGRATVVYTDEDWINAKTQRKNPEFKPDWDLDYFLSYDYLSDFLIFSPSLLKSLWLNQDLQESLNTYTFRHRLVFAALDQSADIQHFPIILSHCRIKQRADAQSIKLLQETFLRSHLPANTEVQVEPQREKLVFRVKYFLPPSSPKVSLIICTRNRVDLLKPFVESILKQTEYRNFEILIIDNQSDDPATLDYFNFLTRQQIAKIVHYDAPFNFAAMNNLAAQSAQGELLCFLNNDMIVNDSLWLGELVSQSLRPEVGIVGAKLFHENHTIQHAGVILGIGWGAGHPHRLTQGTESGYLNRLICTQSFSAVTAACMMIRKTLFIQAEGFNETDFAVAYNDVDLCLRVRSFGLKVIFTPYARLLHLESVSRGSDITGKNIQRFQKEVRALHEKWGKMIQSDPHFNPNLSQSTESFRPAFPPRFAP